ncbi:MAG: hypothetical protein V4805_07635 [Pseudomonadota bacterium]
MLFLIKKVLPSTSAHALLLVLFCQIPCAWARTAFQTRCEDTLPKTISVLSANQNGYSIDTSVSYKMLTRMGSAGTGGFVLGLTKMNSRVEMELSGQVLQDRASAYECIAPQIKVSLIYTPMKVYVGKEFPVGSCPYQEILQHELRHVQIYQAHLPKVEATVREALSKAFQAQPLYAPAGQAQRLLQQKMDDGWLAYIQGEMNKVEAQQAQIDTPAEYARLSKTCGGEMQKILGGG